MPSLGVRSPCFTQWSNSFQLKITLFISQTYLQLPLRQWGCWQCLPLSVVELKDKHCQKTHCRNGVVDTLEYRNINTNNCIYIILSKFYPNCPALNSEFSEQVLTHWPSDIPKLYSYFIWSVTAWMNALFWQGMGNSRITLGHFATLICASLAKKSEK